MECLCHACTWWKREKEMTTIWKWVQCQFVNGMNELREWSETLQLALTCHACMERWQQSCHQTRQKISKNLHCTTVSFCSSIKSGFCNKEVKTELDKSIEDSIGQSWIVCSRNCSEKMWHCPKTQTLIHWHWVKTLKTTLLVKEFTLEQCHAIQNHKSSTINAFQWHQRQHCWSQTGSFVRFLECVIQVTKFHLWSLHNGMDNIHPKLAHQQWIMCSWERKPIFSSHLGLLKTLSLDRSYFKLIFDSSDDQMSRMSNNFLCAQIPCNKANTKMTPRLIGFKGQSILRSDCETSSHVLSLDKQWCPTNSGWDIGSHVGFEPQVLFWMWVCVH